jgi:hypothetical protein
MMIVSAAGAVAIGLSVQASLAVLLMLLLLYSLTILAGAGALTSRRGDERGSAAKGRNHGHSYDNQFRGFPHSAHGAAVSAETLTLARVLRVKARLPCPIGPPDVFAPPRHQCYQALFHRNPRRARPLAAGLGTADQCA